MSGAVRHNFLDLMTALMNSIINNGWKLEHMIVFPVVILKFKKRLASAKDIFHGFIRIHSINKPSEVSNVPSAVNKGACT